MNKKPLIHITRRKDISFAKSTAIRAAAIILALLVCAIITTIVTGLNPFDVYGSMISASFGTSRRLWMLIQNMAMLLCFALALAPAFRMHFWNLGGDGQALVGALAASACMICLSDILPGPVLILVELVTAVLAGVIWALIPAFFKAKWNTNETLFTLMMNYVATQVVAYFVIIWENPKGSGNIGIINPNTEAGWVPELFGNKYLINAIVVILVTVFMYIYMRYTKHGYEVAVVGESENTARYIGIKVGKVVLRTLALSGAICGLAGFLLSAGTNHTLTTTLADNRGFTAVMVAWLAKFNPFGMILTSFLIVFLERGAAEISSTFGLNQAFGDILTGIILFFILGCEFFINYHVHFNKPAKKEEEK
ncbi:MAG: ABC transporter permease [Lachnospiraceae bacterium]|nr:ABC transporter permease [Candidatus Minthocola equi]